jgi:hypothetical protein
MLDALSSAAPAGLTAVNQAFVAAATQTAVPTATVSHANVNTPAGISPAISFNRETDEVIFTYRSAETGKVTEQIPPASATLRYLAVSDSGDAAAPAPARTGTGTGTGSQPSSTTGAQAAPTPATPTAPTAITPNGNPTPTSTSSTLA